MATAENDVIDNDVDQVEEDSTNLNPDEQSEDGADTDTATDEVVVTIGDEKPDTEDDAEEEEIQRAPEWVKNLRKAKRELEKGRREQERKLREQAEEIDRLKNVGKQEQQTVLGEKPTLESCDYDTEKFEQSLTGWHERKRKVEQEAETKRAAVEAEQQAWQGKLNSYAKQKAELKVKDFDDAEAVVKDTMSVVQQGIIINGAENAALLVAALGKNPKKAKELAALTDPVKFAFAVSKLEAQLKVTTRRTPPPPESVVRGSAPISGSVDSTLEKLRAEAEKTGNYSKVTAYKKQQREKRA